MHISDSKRNYDWSDFLDMGMDDVSKLFGNLSIIIH